ncbi:Hpt domain-containing protein [Caulobacter segnis]|uniref:Hpt domain-containing protein n=1 Tax=Caulobacter segnis TaxID=88688 RepID=UPI00240F56DF|nr:Hpt domain-containing protein [Caulobacter segnis]MDG2522558.1 Hpt domain-containing protein [Caulobacter segnis]
MTKDISQAVDFPYLEGFAAGDFVVIDAVLGLFCEQAQIWIALLETDGDQWIDAVHTIKGAARGIGAFPLGEACEHAEAIGPAGIGAVRQALDAALLEVEVYRQSLAAKA